MLAVALLSAGGYAAREWQASNGDRDGADESASDPAEAVPVAVEVAVRGPISHSLASTANLRARREVEIAAQIAGIVTAVHVEEGDFVEADATLCSLDDRELRIDLQLAEQRLAQTKIQVESARIRKEQTETQIRNKRQELERNEKALADGLLAESEVALERHQIEDLEHELRVVESSVRENLHRIDQLTSEIRKVQLQLSQTSITAPFAGRVTERAVELGQSVRVADKLFELGAFRPLYADVFLAEHDSRRTRPGQPVSIRLGTGRDAAQGEVERVSPVVDSETGTVKVTTRFRDPGEAFRPGSFVRGRDRDGYERRRRSDSQAGRARRGRRILRGSCRGRLHSSPSASGARLPERFQGRSDVRSARGRDRGHRRSGQAQDGDLARVVAN